MYMQDPSFNGYLLNFWSILCPINFILFFQFCNHHYKDPKAFSCYKQPFIECGIPQCLGGIFILFDATRVELEFTQEK